MSYEIAKSITIKNNKVYLTTADSSLRPLHFNRWECESLTKILSSQGRELFLRLLEKMSGKENSNCIKGISCAICFLSQGLKLIPWGSVL